MYWDEELRDKQVEKMDEDIGMLKMDYATLTRGFGCLTIDLFPTPTTPVKGVWISPEWTEKKSKGLAGGAGEKKGAAGAGEEEKKGEGAGAGAGADKDKDALDRALDESDPHRVELSLSKEGWEDLKLITRT